MKLFGLRAKGESVNGYVIKIYSKKLFSTEEKVKNHIPEFKKLCMDKKIFDYFPDEKDFKIEIVNFEFQDGD